MQREYQTQQQTQMQQVAAYLQQREQGWKQQHDSQQARVRALMGLEPQADPETEIKNARMRQQLQELYPELKNLGNMQQQTPAHQTPEFQQMAQRLDSYERMAGERDRRFGAERRREMFSLAKESMGKDMTKEQATLVGMTLNGLLRDNRAAQQAFFHDPNFMRDFWKLYSGHLMSPGAKAAAAAQQQQTQQPTGPQSQPGGGGVPAAATPKLSADEKLAKHFANLNQKYPGQYA